MPAANVDIISQPTGTRVSYNATGLLHELFEQCADACGDALAIVRGDISLSYAEVEARSNQLAHHIRSLGVTRGMLVGVAFERSEQPIIAVLACLKAGAAYVPIDPTYPDERIRYIADEAAVTVMVTERSLAARIGTFFRGSIVAVDVHADKISKHSDRRLARAETGLTPQDLCYVIYTSGTTGRPKGVMTEHRNAHHFVNAFNEVCLTTRDDRIYQGFSLSFDGSVEEIWMAFSNGASLLVGTPETPRFGNDLAHFLTQQNATYFSTVPTMLSTMTEDVPSLRQVVVSGEICPPELVSRWARPGRLMLNVYGPTEATVNTTAFVCEPGRPVTIGRPLPGYVAWALDPDMRPCPQGEQGELYIGSAGVSRGYLKQPELTARHFVSWRGERLYRTGDLVRILDNGEIEFFGRIDDQVKIRGYRVELSEIESVLREQPSVTSAAVNLVDREAVATLAAYVVLDQDAATQDRSLVLRALRARLPAYMVPSYLDVVPALPMLTSGKVNRKALPPPVSPLVEDGGASALPASPLECKIAEVWKKIFKVPTLGVEQDFFLGLGGHSLLAAQTVTALREAGLHIAVRDVYSYPNVRELARYLAIRRPDAEGGKQTAARSAPKPTPRAPTIGAVLLQAFVILTFFVLFATPLAVVIPVVDDVLRERAGLIGAIVYLFVFSLATWLFLLALSVAAKWVIIGRYRPGAYPLWGSYYLRCWLVARLQGLSGAGMFVGTPLMPVFYRLMGATVGRHCAIDTALCSIWDLVSIGDDTSIGADTQILGYRIEDGWLRIGRIDIGHRCFIGGHSALGLNVAMGDGARLDDQSLLPDGTMIPEGEGRRGSPAVPADIQVPAGNIRRYGNLQLALFMTAALILGVALGFLLALPGLALMLLWLYAFQQGHLGAVVLGSLLGLPFLIAGSCIWVALIKALVLVRGKPGTHPLYSVSYLRHWLCFGLMRATRALFLPVFTTLYLPPWIRLLGAKVGSRAEMSTIWSFIPDLLTIGEESFLADGCILGGRRLFGGRFEIRENRIGRRSFVGNGAMLPTGATLGDGCLLGVLSAPASMATEDGTDWLGSPAFRLPNRQKVAGFDERSIYRPTRKLYLQRALVDGCRILIPSLVATILGFAGLVALLCSYEAYGSLTMVLIAPLLGVVAAIVAVAVVVTLKWTVMGTFKPVVVPLWCPYVWLNEMINGAYELVMAPVVATFFGTPFAAPLLRLLGCKIGRHCYIGTSLFSEFDLVDVGDHVSLNAGAVIQNHLFEDRIMKSSLVTIGDQCSVGNMTVVLYDTCMERGAVLGPLSLLMKGETIPADGRRHGIPTVAS